MLPHRNFNFISSNNHFFYFLLVIPGNQLFEFEVQVDHQAVEKEAILSTQKPIWKEIKMNDILVVVFLILVQLFILWNQFKVCM